MKTLALELSSGQGSIAWREAAAESFVISFANDRKHSGFFFENLQSCLKRFGQPDRIVVGLGPGSYAGTRIAIATATGLAAADGAALAGVPSFCAMETDASEYAVIGDARRQSFFFALVRDRRCMEGPVLFSEAEMMERLRGIEIPIFATEPLEQFPGVRVTYPSAIILLDLEAQKTSAPLEPIYLRAPHITAPRPAISYIR